MNYDRLAGNTEKKKRGPGKPWVKGQSGNPSGRPKKSLLQRRVEEEFESEEFVEEALTAIKRTMTSAGMAGVLERKHWSDRVDGPVRQELDITGSVSLSLADAINKRRQASE